MLQEVSQIKQIRELTIAGIGFCAVNGFEETNREFDLISGEQLYS